MLSDQRSRIAKTALSIILAVMMVLGGAPAQALAEAMEETGAQGGQEVASGGAAQGQPAGEGKAPAFAEELAAQGDVADEDAAPAPQSDEDDRSALGAQSASVRNPRVAADSNMSSGQVATWDCVWFGSYPQTEVKPGDATYSMLAAAGVTWNAQGDATVGGAKYRRISRSDTTNDDRWSDDSADWRYFCYEPIKWRVLKVSSSKVLVVSDIALDDQRYDAADAEWGVFVTWESSTIRSWLNGYDASANGLGNSYADKNFVDAAFSSVEKGAIVTTSVVNDSSAFGAAGGNDTEDTIFLLSESEVSGSDGAGHGFISDVRAQDATRCCRMSDYARAMGARWDSSDKPYEDRYCDWWLRSPGAEYIRTMYHHNAAGYVRCDGWVDGWDGSYPHDINSNDVAVRPALNLDLSSSLISYAGTVSSDGSTNEQGAAPDPTVPTVSAQFFVSQADVGRQDVDVEFEWDMDTMLPGGDAASRGFDVRLAVPSLVLCGAANQESFHEEGRTSDILQSMGFENIGYYNFLNNVSVNTPGVVCGYRRLETAGGGHKNVFAVIVRGTTTLGDITTDLLSVFSSFRTAATNTKGSLEAFMRDNVIPSTNGLSSLDDLKAERDSNVFLLCGHSLGGATVNHMALDLGEYASDDNVYAYTFAAVKNTYQRDARSSIHNVVNDADWVPTITQTGVLRNGHDVRFDPRWDDAAFTGAFESLTGKSWKAQSHGLTRYSIPLSTRFLNNHHVETYMAYLMARHDSSYSEGSHSNGWSYARWRLVRVACPVDVEVLAGDEVVGRVSGGEVDTTLENAAPVWVDGDDKYVLMPADLDFDVRMTATGEGTMEYSVTELDSDEVVGEKTFTSVALKEGRAFSSSTAADGEADGAGAAVGETRLLVLDEADTPTLEVKEDGSELPLVDRAEVTVGAGEVAYDGRPHEPKPTVTLGGKTLAEGADYELSYEKNVNPGTATVTVTGKGNYAGSKSVAFRIVARSQWVKKEGTWYYYGADGSMVKGWQKVGGKWYYLNPGSGAMKTGWLKTVSTWYYLTSSGAMAVGWAKVGSVWYCFNASGAMATGWLRSGSAWYYLRPSGAMAVGWAKVGSTWYYFASSGAMCIGWQKVGNAWYYLQPSGAMAVGWCKVGSTWYYFASSGAMCIGWLKLGSTWYYFNASGAMVTGRQNIGGKWYTFSSSGAWVG